MSYSKALPALHNLNPGDIIGFSGFNLESYFINVVTYGWPGWSISHVGIVGHYKGHDLIFESTTDSPHKCEVQRAYVQGTQAHKLEHIYDYKGRIWHYPLVKPLRGWESKALTRYLTDGLGRRYDVAGARRAGAKVWSWIQARLYPENQEALFCSEWVAGAHRFIERFDTPNISSWSPNALIREERRRGILHCGLRLK